MVLKVEMSKVEVTRSISAFYNNDYYGTSMLMKIWLTIVKRCVNEWVTNFLTEHQHIKASCHRGCYRSKMNRNNQQQKRIYWDKIKEALVRTLWMPSGYYYDKIKKKLISLKQTNSSTSPQCHWPITLGSRRAKKFLGREFGISSQICKKIKSPYIQNCASD